MQERFLEIGRTVVRARVEVRQLVPRALPKRAIQNSSPCFNVLPLLDQAGVFGARTNESTELRVFFRRCARVVVHIGHPIEGRRTSLHAPADYIHLHVGLDRLVNLLSDLGEFDLRQLGNLLRLDQDSDVLDRSPHDRRLCLDRRLPTLHVLPEQRDRAAFDIHRLSADLLPVGVRHRRVRTRAGREVRRDAKRMQERGFCCRTILALLRFGRLIRRLLDEIFLADRSAQVQPAGEVRAVFLHEELSGVHGHGRLFCRLVLGDRHQIFLHLRM